MNATHRIRAALLSTLLAAAAAAQDPVVPVPSSAPGSRPAPTPPDESMATGNREFCAALHRVLAADRAGEDLAFSPVSIRVAMAMLRAGASGETRTELERALHLGGDRENLALQWRRWFDDLFRAAGGSPGSSPDFEIRRADAAWFRQGDSLKPAYVEHLRREFAAEITALAFQADPDAARRRINEWVSARTAGRIPELLKPKTIGPATTAVLTDALWVAAAWAQPLQRDPAPRAFHAAAGDVEVPFVVGRQVLPCFADESLTAVAVPLAGRRLAMAFVLPAAGTDLAAVEAGLDGARLAAVLDALRRGQRRARVDLALPRCQVRSPFTLNDALQELGVRRVFGSGAELDGIADGPLFVSLVAHEATVSLDENGVQAAAATAVVIERGAPVAAEALEFHADRPFLFAMFDRATGAVLFFGRVARPQV